MSGCRWLTTGVSEAVVVVAVVVVVVSYPPLGYSSNAA